MSISTSSFGFAVENLPLPVPPGVREGIALVKEAIGLEQRKDYWAARTKYVEAAVKIVEGSAAYPDGSSERRAARQKAAQYAPKQDEGTRDGPASAGEAVQTQE